MNTCVICNKEVMRRSVCVLPAVLGMAVMLSACGVQAPDVAESPEVVISEELSEELPEEATIPESLSLRDNYYRYVDREFIETTKIPEGRACYTWFSILDQQNIDFLNGLLDEMILNYDDLDPDSDEHMIAGFYLTACDEDSREAAGLGPFQDYIDRIQACETAQELLEIDGEMNRDFGFAGILQVIADNDAMDSSQYCRAIYGTYSFLSKETLLDDSFEDLRPSYETFLAECLKRAGYDDSESEFRASQIVDFQVGIAPCGLGYIELGIPDYFYNVYTVSELDDLFSNVDITGFLKTSELDACEQQVVFQPDLCAKINEVLTDEDLDFLKAYESGAIVMQLADFADVPLCQAWLDFCAALYGRNGTEDMNEYFGDVTQAVFENEFGKMYVRECFSEEDKLAATELISSIIDRYRERITELDWMTDSTKKAAIEKLDNVAVLVGYPDEWDCYYDASMIKGPDEGGTLIDNAYTLCRADAEHDFAIISAPVDRYRWQYGVQTVNAFASYSMNSICIPAGILQAPFYSSDASPEENYGGIGFHIGHEISHVFDSSGSLYDADGNANVWWTDEDYANFEILTQKMIDYYDGMEYNGRKINGARTVNENIADLGGINVISSFFEDDPEALDKMFRQYVWVIASVYTDDFAAYLISSDEHAPDEIRANGILRNLDSFYETYPEITEGDGMYLAPEDRIKIW